MHDPRQFEIAVGSVVCDNESSVGLARGRQNVRPRHVPYIDRRGEMHIKRTKTKNAQHHSVNDVQGCRSPQERRPKNKARQYGDEFHVAFGCKPPRFALAERFGPVIRNRKIVPPIVFRRRGSAGVHERKRDNRRSQNDLSDSGGGRGFDRRARPIHAVPNHFLFAGFSAGVDLVRGGDMKKRIDTLCDLANLPRSLMSRLTTSTPGNSRSGPAVAALFASRTVARTGVPLCASMRTRL
jgi:hypothetical protein